MSEQVGTAEICRAHAITLTEHTAQLQMINRRMDEVMSNQKDMTEALSTVRQKLFNGYDEKITHTNDKVDELVGYVKILMERKVVDQSEVVALVDKKILEESVAQANALRESKRWFQKYRLEILTTVSAICMVAVAVLTFIVGLSS